MRILFHSKIYKHHGENHSPLYYYDTRNNNAIYCILLPFCSIKIEHIAPCITPRLTESWSTQLQPPKNFQG